MPNPTGVLGQIVAAKRIDVAARLGNATLDDMLSRAQPSTRSLAAVLAKPGARFVMEVKRASPSQGTLRSDIDPAAIACAYMGAADAISVLTDAPWFGGSFADLAAVRAAFDGPVLCKDFTVDPRQIPEARLHGADAVLLMLSVLDDAEVRACLDVCEALGMEALVEAHDEAEVRRAVALGARVVGINNRDLRTLKVDLAVTERLAALVPADRILVAESGIETRADIVRLGRHADAFLVGSSLMRSADHAAAARALAYGRVKICGLTNSADTAAARRAGACFAGLIRVPGTPRYVDAAAARRLAEHAEMPVVGVFRDAPASQVAEFARNLNVAAVQLHGAEDSRYINDLSANLPSGCEIWAAVSADDAIPPARSGATRTLFDTGAGGTGRTFDWSRLAGHSDLPTGILAGGLYPGNAAAASRVGAWALDVSSGVEASPGRKDPAKLAAFFDALRVPTREKPVLQPDVASNASALESAA
ncbi:MAG: Indole-3-glycerol phosphate synthase / Phosphoribosylanthranilate isomerase [uncultured Sphingomonadaceae bacterium]|uniref:Multifunctional fusion protein n=1 Tax=uncultured Sphingomonadaceae bacterium TaxID=169976 RepID=A0A6J4SRW6_9SPHN|nr:MAG: Indole-3-glycerol phosphate synthase / Phosphoribosylanthranilate isomerase [uncultured Sphingomonadaceae bacterium]